ncbi:MAG: hypothetical protein JO356_07495 [Acidobacteria bacterium]|nr:hypothetical protein [Acidobacteriota bacterium]
MKLAVHECPASPSPRQRHARGYILLVLLLLVALLSIGFLSMVRRIDFQIKRDREEEMIHRGVQYSRAVRRYFKKFGRYPTRIEDLENTNEVRFLRKRYKDPITGKDFKLLHLTDLPQLASASPNLSSVAVRSSGTSGVFGAGAQGNFVSGTTSSISSQQPGAPGALNGASAPAGPGPNAIAGNDSTPAGAQADTPSSSSNSVAAPAPQPLAQQLGTSGAPQVFGGGAIIGVTSVSKDHTIREFNKKNHYNEWQFIYDPTTDRGGLLMTPNQPALQGAVPASQMQSQPSGGQPGFPAANQPFGAGQPTQAPPPQAAPQQ